jgi:hypothetical protein
MVPTSAFAAPATQPATARPRAGSAAAAALGGSGVRQPARSGVARQIKDQRRGYARAVLQGLARTYQGRPASSVAPILRQALVPLGVRLSAARLRELPRHIEAGQPVQLP